MSVTAAGGFRAAAGPLDGVAVLISDGPSLAAAGVFPPAQSEPPGSGESAGVTSGDGAGLAAPALWSRQVLAGGLLRAVAILPARAGAAVPDAFADVHQTAEYLARVLTKLGPREIGAGEIAVCWTASPGPRPLLGELLGALSAAAAAAKADGELAPPGSVTAAGGYSVGGTALPGDRAAGTVLLTSDADLPAAALTEALAAAGLGAGTALLLASGASGTKPDPAGFAALLAEACAGLTRAAA